MNFNESEHPRDKDGKFKDKQDLFKEAEETVEEEQTKNKIKKVNIEIDKDNILPELNKKELETMGISESKPVLVKKSSIIRNLTEHGDVKPEDFNFIIGNTLYCPDKIIKGKNPNRDYYSFVKKLSISRHGNVLNGVVLLDVDKEKDHFEVVHWHWVKDKNLKSI